jgi:hypothetical protein
MQAAKDTFLKTLAARLSVVNPARTVMLDGTLCPAVIATENQTPVPPNTELESFLLSWEGASHATPEAPLMYMDCKLSYSSRGTDAKLRTDRGRIITAMDSELLQLCQQRYAVKCDYTQTPPCALGTNIFWTQPVMTGLTDADGILLRTATIRLFFFPEVG